MAKLSLKVAILASEAAPFAKAGGLGDVIGSLPQALGELGVETKVFIPMYKFIDAKKWGLELIIEQMSVELPHGVKVKVSVWQGLFPHSLSPIYFLEIPRYFVGDQVYNQNKSGRENGTPFVVFTRAALEVIRALDWRPDIIHSHDWMTAIACKWLHTLYKNDPFFARTASVLTIHNLAYKGKFGWQMTKMLGLKRQDFHIERQFVNYPGITVFASGIEAADMINTVSPTYAREIMTKQYGAGLDRLMKSKKHRLSGILNGIDYTMFDPMHDQSVVTHYSIHTLYRKVENKKALQAKFGLPINPDCPVVAIVSRLTNQKGFDLLDQTLPDLIKHGAQFIVLGSGSEKNKKIFIAAEKKYPQQVATKLFFDAELAQLVYAGSDMLLMPSKFEPMGLSQIIAMRFGTIPIVRKTGGLSDTVLDGRTGFVFIHYDAHAFTWAIRRALDIWYNHKDRWQEMQERAMKKDFSWKSSAKKYVSLYRKALQYHNNNHKPLN